MIEQLRDQLLQQIKGDESGHTYAWGGGGILFLVLLIVVLLILF